MAKMSEEESYRVSKEAVLNTATAIINNCVEKPKTPIESRDWTIAIANTLLKWVLKKPKPKLEVKTK